VICSLRRIRRPGRVTRTQAADVPIDPAVLPTVTRPEQLAERTGIELVTLSLDEVVGALPVAGNRQPPTCCTAAPTPCSCSSAPGCRRCTRAPAPPS
jgi:hypothetical protein